MTANTSKPKEYHGGLVVGEDTVLNVVAPSLEELPVPVQVQSIAAEVVEFSACETRNQMSRYHIDLRTGAIDLGQPVVFSIKRQDGGPLEVRLPDQFREPLAEYVAESRRGVDFDCISFLHKLHGVPYEYANGVDLNNWKWRNFSPWAKVEPGHSILTTEHEGEVIKIRHAAMYIGERFFLSKAGNNAPLILSNSDVIEALWGGSPEFILNEYAGKRD